MVRLVQVGNLTGGKSPRGEPSGGQKTGGNTGVETSRGKSSGHPLMTYLTTIAAFILPDLADEEVELPFI